MCSSVTTYLFCANEKKNILEPVYNVAFISSKVQMML